MRNGPHVDTFTARMIMAIYGYCRVSTDRQAEEGESLGAQQRTIEGYALMHGLTLDHIYVERGVSGSKPLGTRPEGSKLLATLSPGDVVIAPKLDRMFRSAVDALNCCEDFKKWCVGLHLIDLGGDVTGNGISKLVFTILSAVAEAERDRIRERIKDVKADQRDRSRFLGGKVPFGFDVSPDGALVGNADHQAAITTMQQLRSHGTSFRDISTAVYDQHGIELSHAGVAKVLGRLAA